MFGNFDSVYLLDYVVHVDGREIKLLELFPFSVHGFLSSIGLMGMKLDIDPDSPDLDKIINQESIDNLRKFSDPDHPMAVFPNDPFQIAFGYGDPSYTGLSRVQGRNYMNQFLDCVKVPPEFRAQVPDIMPDYTPVGSILHQRIGNRPDFAVACFFYSLGENAEPDIYFVTIRPPHSLVRRPLVETLQPYIINKVANFES